MTRRQKWSAMMSDLEKFRLETRAWLEENCPKEMRDGAVGEEFICWGGRNWKFKSEERQQVCQRRSLVVISVEVRNNVLELIDQEDETLEAAGLRELV